MQQVTIREAKATLDDLIDAAVHGEEVVIITEKQQAIQLVPRGVKKRTRTFGSAKGLITMAEDFDAELPDFKEYME